MAIPRRPPMFDDDLIMPGSPGALERNEAKGMGTGIPSGMPMPPPPPPPPLDEEGGMDFTSASDMRAFPKQSTAPTKEVIREDIEEISEKIIEGKWKSVSDDIKQIDDFKEEAKLKITKLQENFERIGIKMEAMEKAIFGKVEEYSKGISNVNVELKAMQMVFKTMLPEFTASIKELRSLVTKAAPKLKKVAEKKTK